MNGTQNEPNANFRFIRMSRKTKCVASGVSGEWARLQHDDVEGRGIGLYRDGGNEIPLFGCEQGDSSTL